MHPFVRRYLLPFGHLNHRRNYAIPFIASAVSPCGFCLAINIDVSYFIKQERVRPAPENRPSTNLSALYPACQRRQSGRSLPQGWKIPGRQSVWFDIDQCFFNYFIARPCDEGAPEPSASIHLDILTDFIGSSCAAATQIASERAGQPSHLR